MSIIQEIDRLRAENAMYKDALTLVEYFSTAPDPKEDWLKAIGETVRHVLNRNPQG